MTSFPRDGQFFHFWKGRVGLWAILRALGVSRKDEVIVPGFTCVALPNAVLYVGATPIYADIEPETYNVSVATLEPLLNDRTRAIVVQSTFGLSPDLDPIVALAERRGIVMIEDCAQGLGGRYRGTANGLVGHAAFFSTQWSKPISTGLGGVVYTKDATLASAIEQLVNETNMPYPSAVDQALLGGQLLVRPLADLPILHYPLVSAYRLLTQRLGVTVGSSSEQEVATARMPPQYAKRMGSLQLWGWKRGLEHLDARVTRRQDVAARYDDFFASTSVETPCRPDYAEHAMLRYPIRVSAKAELLRRARRLHNPVGDWFVSPLHPVEGDLSQWSYQEGQCPVAERACRETINLPTDRLLSNDQLARLFAAELGEKAHSRALPRRRTAKASL